MANGTVAIKFKFDGADKFHTLELDLENISGALKDVNENARTLDAKMVNLASRTQLMESLGSVVQQLSGVFNNWTSAYQEQQVAETKLAQAMRNTMGASNVEIESIKQLCSEQQKLGVIGEEVQLAASQELATYLTMSDNLKTLIPVMNDMVAQQYGLGASAESATQIASMLGKVMNGQTEALSRYGYKFDETQKYILQFGDESERAAVLAQVVTEAVGGMNAELARTPAGRMQHLRDRIDDVKEALGKAVKSLMPYMAALSSVTNVVAGYNRVKAAIQALASAHTVLVVKTRLAAAATTAFGTISKFATASAHALVASVKTLTGATMGFNVALNIVYATLTMGISVVITALVSLFSSLSGKANEASNALGNVDEATQAYNDAAGEARGAMAKEIVELENLIKKHGDETAKIQELNEKYGETFGYHNTAKEWYDTLINKSKDYCRQLGYEAKAKALTAKIGALEVEKDELNEVIAAVDAQGGAEKALKNQGKGYFVRKAAAKEYNETVVGRRDEVEKQLDNLYKDLDQTNGKAEEARNAVSNGSGNGEVADWREMSYNQLEDEIKNQKTAVGNLAGVAGKETEAKEAQKLLRQMEDRQKMLGRESGLDKDTSTSGASGKTKYNGDNLIAEAKNYNELSNNVKYYEQQIAKADASDKVQLANLAKGYADAKKKVDDFSKAKEKALLEAQKPEEIQSVGDIQSLEQVNKAIEYQQKLRNSASAEDLKNIDAEIKRLNDLKTAFEDSSHVELKTKEIQTYKQLEEEISFYSRQLKTASETDRKKIQEHIVELEDLKKKWDDVIDEISKPGDISTLNTIEELDEAISWYSNRQKKKSGQEYVDIQKIINALQQKKKLMEAPASTETRIAEMQVETGQLGNLEGKSLKMKLELVGLDGVAQKIREIQQMMNDPSATEDQKKALKKLQDEYIGYYKQLLRTDKGLIQTWGSVKGLGNSIEGMTEAIKGQGNAWKKISGIIDSTISLYQSISQIIEIVKMLTGVTKIQEGAEKAKGQASLQAGMNALTGSEQQVSASMSNTIANETETVSAEGKALAEGVSSASGIPFPYNLIAIGVTVAAVIAALMTSLPKLASGGIATGPTLALVGEYPGASTNPEVIMPANKLKGLLREDLGIGGNVTFRIEGRNLVGVLGKESHYRSRR
ncbi:MAG: hypothetical protein E7108_08780 [Bacteroidales bacterium]|jgi:hypothetical protein|nr:hypothetical protein [Bacteroidales bacterium]